MSFLYNNTTKLSNTYAALDRRPRPSKQTPMPGYDPREVEGEASEEAEEAEFHRVLEQSMREQIANEVTIQKELNDLSREVIQLSLAERQMGLTPEEVARRQAVIMNRINDEEPEYMPDTGSDPDDETQTPAAEEVEEVVDDDEEAQLAEILRQSKAAYVERYGRLPPEDTPAPPPPQQHTHHAPLPTQPPAKKAAPSARGRGKTRGKPRGGGRTAQRGRPQSPEVEHTSEEQQEEEDTTTTPEDEALRLAMQQSQQEYSQEQEEEDRMLRVAMEASMREALWAEDPRW